MKYSRDLIARWDILSVRSIGPCYDGSDKSNGEHAKVYEVSTGNILFLIFFIKAKAHPFLQQEGNV